MAYYEMGASSIKYFLGNAKVLNGRSLEICTGEHLRFLAFRRSYVLK